MKPILPKSENLFKTIDVLFIPRSFDKLRFFFGKGCHRLRSIFYLFDYFGKFSADYNWVIFATKTFLSY